MKRMGSCLANKFPVTLSLWTSVYVDGLRPKLQSVAEGSHTPVISPKPVPRIFGNVKTVARIEHPMKGRNPDRQSASVATLDARRTGQRPILMLGSDIFGSLGLSRNTESHQNSTTRFWLARTVFAQYAANRRQTFVDTECTSTTITKPGLYEGFSVSHAIEDLVRSLMILSDFGKRSSISDVDVELIGYIQ